jgi:uncharacterized membrane protein YhaH (DUF805 family)
MEVAVTPNPRSSKSETPAVPARSPLDVVLGLVAVPALCGAALSRLSTDPVRIIQALSTAALARSGVGAVTATLKTKAMFWMSALATGRLHHRGNRVLWALVLALLPAALYFASEIIDEDWMEISLKIAACIAWVWGFVELELLGDTTKSNR